MKLLFVSAAFFWAMIALASASGYDGGFVHLAATPPSEVMTEAIRNKHKPHDPISRAVNSDDPIETPPVPETSPNPQDASVLLGVSCWGSGRCSTCNTNIDKILDLLELIADNTYYRQGQQIACSACDSTARCVAHQCAGLCVFALNLTRGQRISAMIVKEKVRMIKQHGCKKCGSCPIYPGNNVNDGEITVSFLWNGCRDGVC